MKGSIFRVSAFRLLTVWVSLGFISLWFSGCVAPIPFRLDPASSDGLGEVQASACVEKDSVSIQVLASGYGAGLGLVGAIIDSGVNSSRRRGAEETIAPLREETQDISVRDDLLNALSPMLKELPWPQVVDVKMSSESLPVTVAEVRDNSVLRLYTTYQLSSTAEVLEIRTGFAFYLRGNTKAAAAGSVFYASKRIGQFEENEEAVKLWAGDDAAVYREELSLGIEETVKMLSLVLPYAGRKSPVPPLEEQVRMKVRLSHGRGDFGIKASGVTVRGWILEQSEDRILFQRDTGHLYSMPTSDILKRLTP